MKVKSVRMKESVRVHKTHSLLRFHSEPPAQALWWDRRLVPGTDHYKDTALAPKEKMQVSKSNIHPANTRSYPTLS